MGAAKKEGNSERHRESQKSRKRQLSTGDKAALSLRTLELNAEEGLW